MDSQWRRLAPVVALLLFAPIIAEVLYGATRLSTIFVLVPEVGAWGCGALMIRYAARRWRLEWPGMLLLGLALAVAEECIIQQTSLAPLTGLAKAEYGRLWGVNWVYFVWASGYEAVWVVLVPIQLVDLMFPTRREEPWIGRGGFARAAIFFTVAAFLAWYMWTQRARTMVFHMPPFNPPAASLAVAIGVILLLIAAAYRLRGRRTAPQGSTPGPAAAGLAVCLLSIPWGALVLVGYGATPQIPAGWTIAASLLWATFSLFLMHRWSFTAGWQDRHRFAAVCGAIAGSMIGGYVMFAVGGALPMDWIGKIIFNVIAAVWLARLRRRLTARGA